MKISRLLARQAETGSGRSISRPLASALASCHLNKPTPSFDAKYFGDGRSITVEQLLHTHLRIDCRHEAFNKTRGSRKRVWWHAATLQLADRPGCYK